MRMLSLAVALTLTISVTQADARKRHQEAADANGNTATIVSHKTGATARVSASHAAKFQAYIDDLEANSGSVIKFIGGTRRGRCSSSSMHPCGRAIDVCQLRRGVVDSSCNLPNRSAIAAIAARHGLFEGGQWCHSDYGHAQVGESAPACGERTLAARSHRQIKRDVRTARAPNQPDYMSRVIAY